MEDKPIIKSLGLRDLSDCIELDEIALDGMWSKNQWQKELLSPERLCLGCFRVSKLSAMCSGWIISDELHITIVAVHPSQRRKGLGKMILRELINQAAKAGVKRATLEVKENNQAAIYLYSSLGFEVKGYRKNFYRDESDALIFWLN